MPDHIHLFVSAQPKWSPSKIAQCLKAWTSKDLREKFAIIRKTRPETDDLWASSYYCGTAGHVSAEQVARYIRENSSRYWCAYAHCGHSATPLTWGDLAHWILSILFALLFSLILFVIFRWFFDEVRDICKRISGYVIFGQLVFILFSWGVFKRKY